MQERDGDLYVIPDEAVGLLGADRLDPRLFDVTDLIKMGYGDARTRQMPMIASYTRAADQVDATPSAPARQPRLAAAARHPQRGADRSQAERPRLLELHRAGLRPERPHPHAR